MKESIEEMMKRNNTNANAAFEKPTKDQLEANIKISHNWATAVRSGTFSGAQSLHVATLLDFLMSENKKALMAYEQEALTHPEWGVKVELPQPAASA